MGTSKSPTVLSSALEQIEGPFRGLPTLVSGCDPANRTGRLAKVCEFTTRLHVCAVYEVTYEPCRIEVDRAINRKREFTHTSTSRRVGLPSA